MKKIILLLTLILAVSPVFADYVNGYYRSNGTYVNGYHRSSPNYTKMDNYSTRGNYNPYTGAKGYVNPYNNYGSSYNSGYTRMNNYSRYRY